jgi:stage II sporulation protein D
VAGGQLADTFFHSCCGGGTVDAKEVWGGEVPYLVGVACEWCRDATHWTWTETMPLSKLRTRLERSGVRVGELVNVEPGRRDPTLRNLTVVVVGRTRRQEISAHRFRMAVGPEVIRSTRFTVEKAGAGLKFSGFGWGHGVGLCQWGAKGMAERGQTYDAIIRYYYRGVEIRPFRVDYTWR